MDELRYHSIDHDAARRDLPVHDRLHYAHRANMRAYLLFGIVALMCGLAFPVADKTPPSAKAAAATKTALRQAAQPAAARRPPASQPAGAQPDVGPGRHQRPLASVPTSNDTHDT